MNVCIARAKKFHVNDQRVGIINTVLLRWELTLHCTDWRLFSWFDIERIYEDTVLNSSCCVESVASWSFHEFLISFLHFLEHFDATRTLRKQFATQNTTHNVLGSMLLLTKVKLSIFSSCAWSFCSILIESTDVVFFFCYAA